MCAGAWARVCAGRDGQAVRTCRYSPSGACTAGVRRHSCARRGRGAAWWPSSRPSASVAAREGRQRIDWISSERCPLPSRAY
eukprot:scaffold273605_cov37-Tisochrysis_lutea.AAC.3